LKGLEIMMDKSWILSNIGYIDKSHSF